MSVSQETHTDASGGLRTHLVDEVIDTYRYLIKEHIWTHLHTLGIGDNKKGTRYQKISIRIISRCVPKVVIVVPYRYLLR